MDSPGWRWSSWACCAAADFLKTPSEHTWTKSSSAHFLKFPPSRDREVHAMRRRIFWTLIALNLLLAVTLAARWTPGGGENTAVAQVRRPADYIMIPGDVNGGSTSVVYILDTTNGM